MFYCKKENSRRRQQKRRTQRGDLCARTGGRGFAEAESGEDIGAETVQFKEKRVMLYPWMVGMYGGAREAVTRETGEGIDGVSGAGPV